MPHSYNIVQALVLGIVQGITEFLPVSSTAHLRLIPRLMGWQDAGLAFDAALHTGTLIALLLYFWRDWADLVGSTVRGFTRKSHFDDAQHSSKLLWGIIIACIPAAIAGKLVEGRLDAIEKNPNLNTQVMVVVASALIVVGIVLYLADRFGSMRKQKLGQMNIVDFVVIGLAQAVALVWGVSRSGATISAGRIRGLNRDTAARFSLMLSTPIFLGVAMLHIKDVIEEGFASVELVPSIVGLVSAAVVGILVIKFLLGYLRKHSLNIFVWYRLVLGAAILALVAMQVV